MFCFGCCGSVGQFYPYPSGLLHRHWGNHIITPVPVKQPWRIWVSISYIWYDHNKTNTTKLCLYFMGYILPILALTLSFSDQTMTVEHCSWLCLSSLWCDKCRMVTNYGWQLELMSNRLFSGLLCTALTAYDCLMFGPCKELSVACGIQ